MKLKQDEREQSGWRYAAQDWQCVWDLKLVLCWSNQRWLHFSSHTNTLNALGQGHPLLWASKSYSSTALTSPPACNHAAISPCAEPNIQQLLLEEIPRSKSNRRQGWGGEEGWPSICLILLSPGYILTPDQQANPLHALLPFSASHDHKSTLSEWHEQPSRPQCSHLGPRQILYTESTASKQQE